MGLHPLVVKKIRETLPAGVWEDACEMVAHLPDDRVQLAVVKLADGSPDRLVESIVLAEKDWRDAIAGAEYPRQLRVPGPAPADLVAADLAEYEAWLGE